ncbi:MAG: hypothetical protein ABR526_04530 [Chthoniobacterales bacterium]
MSWMNQVASVLQNYTQGGQPAGGDVESHFNQVAQAAPAGDLASSLAAMFRSDQTPPFPQQVSQLFGNSNGGQRANLLNTLLSSGAGGGILSQIMQVAGGSTSGSGQAPHITPEAAAQVSPEMVQQAAAQAEQHDPSIVDRVSQIYAQHPALINTLGTMAMSMAMSQLANRRR